ncbi:MAG: DTW domain-containing protein [Myxococcales bacterium]|nr:DTW domain-containing protein [Myxococcales bacterium]
MIVLDTDIEQCRAYCYRCMRVESMCLCDAFPCCDNRTEIHVLQHDRERRHAFGTVRLLKIGLEGLVVHRMPADSGAEFPKPAGFPDDAGVLYPGPGSLDLAHLSPDQRPKKLVVIDGTWSQAHRMYRDSPWLQRLPRYALHPVEPSRYRIRKEPRQECLSTLESTAMALRLIEPETVGVENLLHTFERMVDRQLVCIEENAAGKRRMKRSRVRPMRAVPTTLWQEPERIVVVYAESALPRSRREKQNREIAQWCAVRLSDSEQAASKLTFESVVASEAEMPSGFFLQELGWEQGDLDRAEPLASALKRWREFLRPNDVLVGWNKGSANLAREHGFGAEVVVLKEVYRNTVVGNFGTLEDVVQREKLEPGLGVAMAGRARKRLANARAAAHYLGLWARERLELE